MTDPNTIKRSFPGGPYQPVLEHPEVCFPHIQVEDLLAAFLLSKILNLTASWSPWPRQPLITTSPTRPSLVAGNRSRRASSLVGSLSTCTKKFTSVCLRNSLGLFVLAAWYSQLVSGELKSQGQGSRIKDRRTRATDLQISLCVLWLHFFL